MHLSVVIFKKLVPYRFDVHCTWGRSAEEANSEKKVTPFEKNLEVWRQLWRVMEKSDLICQLVDARNPLFYYSTDLEAYASELVPPKPMVVIINKADFLSRPQQRDWAQHFGGRGVTVLFFSARAEQERLNREAREERDAEEGGVGRGGSDDATAEGFDSEEETDEEESEAESVERGEEAESQALEGRSKEASRPSGPSASRRDQRVGGAVSGASRGRRTGQTGAREMLHRVLDRLEMCVELERLARTLGAGPDPDRNGGRACVGMVGYPNVGKSSLINVLVGATPLSHGGVRVSVGATPGKTKHFQTLVLSDSLMLCDCPGLVFPSFVSR